jgi:hypothetical protein
MEVALSQENWASGELSPKMRARQGIPIYGQGAERVVNFISETSGPGRFRSGFQFVFGTRRYQPAWLWPFVFNDSDAYEMEFTTGYIRFYRNGGVITQASQDITGATQANPCVLTVVGHGLSNGAEVIVNGVLGMTQLNNRSFVIANATTNTFQLTDNFGNNINSTAYTAYTSGGTISPVYEIQAPYNIADVPALKIGQNADVLYIDHHNYEPMKLTRFSDNDWTISTYQRFGDMCLKQLPITGVSLANPAVVTSPSHGLVTGQQVYIAGLASTMQAASGPPFDGSQLITITVVDVNTFQLNGIDTSSGYTAWSVGGAVCVFLPITAITQANPCQVTVTNHGFVTGDQIIINGVQGMTELNNATGGGVFTITVVDANNFQLNGVNSTGYAAFVASGNVSLNAGYLTNVAGTGTIPWTVAGSSASFTGVESTSKVSEWLEATNFGFDIPATATILGVVVKITEGANVNNGTDGVNDTKVQLIIGGTISGSNYAATMAFWPTTPAAASYGTGTTDLWGLTLTPAEINALNFGVAISATAISGSSPAVIGTVSEVSVTVYYSTGPYVLDKTLLVSALAFYQGRLYHAGSDTYPESMWGSQPLDDNGNPQYDLFNLGAQAGDAFKFTLSPISAKVDKIQSLVPSINFLAVCTLEGISSANGGSTGTPISPSTIDVTPAVTFGCLQQITPFFLGISMLYIHRSGLILYSFEYDIFYSAYNAMDKDLTCEQWSQSALPGGSGISQMVFQVSRPTCFWFRRNDGVLIGRTYMVKENVNGVHRHYVGGVNASVLSVGSYPRQNAYDQLYIVSQRTVNGNVVRFVEYMNDDIVIPELDDFWTGPNNQAADLLTWQNAMFEAQKQYVYLDACLTYDGSVFGTKASATLTPAAVSGNSVVFTASQAVFAASMVGQQLWKQAQNGVGMGRAIILSYQSATQVTCQIITAFDTTTAIPAGEWYLTTNLVQGIWHLIGETVGVLADGASVGPLVVNSVGQVTLPNSLQASVVHVGEQYTGLVKSMAINPPPGQQGAITAKRKTVNQLGIKMLNSSGVSYGTSLYNMKPVPFDRPSNLAGRPIPLFTGTKRVPLEDQLTDNYDKHVYIQQTLPLPCIILAIVPFTDSDDL